MKAFLKRTILIFFTFFIGILFFVFIVHITVKYKYSFSLPKEEKYIILGHSHPACAFNDDLIVNFRNLSAVAEGYFYTYQKVKEILADNNVHAIFIEYSNNLLTKVMDDWIWGYAKMNVFFPVHSPFMGKDDILFLCRKNYRDFPKVISTSTRKNLARILSFDFAIGQRYGGYAKFDGNKVPALIKFIKERNSNIKEIPNPKKHELSVDNLNYLEKIVDYCKVNNVKVFLIRSPQHRLFPRENEEELLSIKDEKFASLDFLDFDRFPLKDSEFGDFGHINYKGAEVFSLWFNELIKGGLLSKKNKAVFINEEIEKARTHDA